jgi:hypothetical protein
VEVILGSAPHLPSCSRLTGYPEIILSCLKSRIFGKFDGSGVSGSTGRGRSQALESKVRFADHPSVKVGNACQPLGFRRLRLWNAECPREAEHKSASLRTSQGAVLVIVFEEGREVLGRQNEIGLNTNTMN